MFCHAYKKQSDLRIIKSIFNTIHKYSFGYYFYA